MWVGLQVVEWQGAEELREAGLRVVEQVRRARLFPEAWNWTGEAGGSRGLPTNWMETTTRSQVLARDVDMRK
jgi:hypothetical protein